MLDSLVSWAATMWEAAYYRANEELSLAERGERVRARSSKLPDGPSPRIPHSPSCGSEPDVPGTCAAEQEARHVEEVARLLCRYHSLDKSQSTELFRTYEQVRGTSHLLLPG